MNQHMNAKSAKQYLQAFKADVAEAISHGQNPRNVGVLTAKWGTARRAKLRPR
jgi:hypothetical protein